MGTNRFKCAARRAGMALAAVHLAAGYALAQGGGLNSVNAALGQANQQMKGMVGTILTGLQIITGVIALFCIVTVVIKFNQGDREAAKKLGYWVAGIVLFELMVALVKAVFGLGG